MDAFELITAQLNEKIDKIVEDAEQFRLAVLKKIEDARNNEILSSIKALGTRLDNIERRLPSEEDEEERSTRVRSR